MRRWTLLPLALAALLVIPRARAEDDSQASRLWQRHVKRFDLDGDGRITWEEYQKVTSGFTFFDSNKDGVITEDDVEALAKKLGAGANAWAGGAAIHLAAPFAEMDDDWSILLPFLLGSHAGATCAPPQGAPPMPWTRGMQTAPWMRYLSPWTQGAPAMPQGGPWMQGMPWMQGGPWMQGSPWMQGGPWMQGAPWMHGGPGTRGAPWMRPGTPGAGRDAGPGAGAPPPPRPEGAAPPAFGDLAEMIPGPMRDLAAFAALAQDADTNDDEAVDEKEWKAALAAVTKEDGTLDLTRLEPGVGFGGSPFPGGAGALLESLLDTNHDGKVEASDLEGVFAKVDRNGDGKVTQDELAPPGMGGFPFGGGGR